MTARLAACVALLVASGAAIAQTPATRYTVEIVVFRSSSLIGGLPATAPAEAVADDGVEMTASTSRKLAAAASKLKANGMKVLAHTSWTQTPVACARESCRTALRGVTAEQLGLARMGISGKVGLQRGDYLHLGIDLTIEDGGRRYRIREIRPLEARQLKAEQPQYFDHPAVGVLAVITAAAP